MYSIITIARRAVTDTFKNFYTERDSNYNDSVLRFPTPSQKYIDLRSKMNLKVQSEDLGE